jgi:uncharacterized protein YyaL (SSP411 family)
MGTLLLVTLLAHATLDVQGTRAIDQRLSDFVWAAFDTSHGGFVSRGGVPEESAVELAIAHGDGPWMSRATTTLDWTHGLMDTLVGGFFTSRLKGREDEDVLLKRTDVNARRLENLTDAWQHTHDAGFKQDADRVVDFMERVLLDGRGGFVIAQVGDRDLEPRSNGLAIHAWLVWAAATRSSSQRDFALRSLDRLWEICWTPPLGMVRKDNFGDLSIEPQLLDQVEMGRAYVLAARLCGRAEDRDRAIAIGQLVTTRFAERDGGFRTQSMPKKDGSIKKAPKSPLENARAARFLGELAALTGDAAMKAAAERTIETFRSDWSKPGYGAADWALAARACYAPNLPEAPAWAMDAQEREEPVHPRVVRIKTGRR